MTAGQAAALKEALSIFRDGGETLNDDFIRGFNAGALLISSNGELRNPRLPLALAVSFREMCAVRDELLAEDTP